MKLAGRIFLLISGILFLVWGIWDIISLIQKASSVLASGDSSLVLSWVISLALNILEIIAGLGGIFYFIGKGPFKSWVGPLAIIYSNFLCPRHHRRRTLRLIPVDQCRRGRDSNYLFLRLDICQQEITFFQKISFASRRKF